MNPFTIFQLIAAIGPIVTGALQSSGVLSPSTSSLVTAIETAVTDFGSALTSTPSGQFNVTAATILAGISAAVSVLQKDTTLSPVALAYVRDLDRAIGAGMTAIQEAQKAVVVSDLQPIAPIA